MALSTKHDTLHYVLAEVIRGCFENGMKVSPVVALYMAATAWNGKCNQFYIEETCLHREEIQQWINEATVGCLSVSNPYFYTLRLQSIFEAARFDTKLCFSAKQNWLEKEETETLLHQIATASFPRVTYKDARTLWKWVFRFCLSATQSLRTNQKDGEDKKTISQQTAHFLRQVFPLVNVFCFVTLQPNARKKYVATLANLVAGMQVYRTYVSTPTEKLHPSFASVVTHSAPKWDSHSIQQLLVKCKQLENLWADPYYVTALFKVDNVPASNTNPCRNQSKLLDTSTNTARPTPLMELFNTVDMTNLQDRPEIMGAWPNLNKLDDGRNLNTPGTTVESQTANMRTSAAATVATPTAVTTTVTHPTPTETSLHALRNKVCLEFPVNKIVAQASEDQTFSDAPFYQLWGWIVSFRLFFQQMVVYLEDLRDSLRTVTDTLHATTSLLKGCLHHLHTFQVDLEKPIQPEAASSFYALGKYTLEWSVALSAFEAKMHLRDILQEQLDGVDWMDEFALNFSQQPHETTVHLHKQPSEIVCQRRTASILSPFPLRTETQLLAAPSDKRLLPRYDTLHIDKSVAEKDSTSGAWLFSNIEEQASHVAIKGYCPIALVKYGCTFIKGNPELGALAHKGAAFLFSNEEAYELFANDAERYFQGLLDLCKIYPQLIELLDLQAYFSNLALPKLFQWMSTYCQEVPPSFHYSNLQERSMLRLVSVPSQKHVATMTPTVFEETNHVMGYEWSQWKLRKRFLQYASIMEKATHGTQTLLTTYRKAKDVQVSSTHSKGTSTLIDESTGTEAFEPFVYGFRGCNYLPLSAIIVQRPNFQSL